MHFNDLILKIRIQALGALAAVVTVGGVLLKTVSSDPKIPWGLLSFAFLVLLAFWIAIWQLDFLYYNRLLMGAVDSLLELENAINDEKDLQFNMSHKIEDAVIGKSAIHRQQYTLRGPLLFYLIVMAVLLISLAYCFCKFLHAGT